MKENLKSEFVKFILRIIGDRENLLSSEVLHVASPLANSFNFAGISEKNFVEQISDVSEIAPAYSFSSTDGFRSSKGSRSIKCQACLDGVCQEEEFFDKSEAISFFLNFGKLSEKIEAKRLVYDFLAEKFRKVQPYFYWSAFKGDTEKLLNGLKAFNIAPQELIDDYIKQEEFEEHEGLYFKLFRDYDSSYMSAKSRDLRVVASDVLFDVNFEYLGSK